jgi:hypothetical protein
VWILPYGAAQIRRGIVIGQMVHPGRAEIFAYHAHRQKLPLWKWQDLQTPLLDRQKLPMLPMEMNPKKTRLDF